jgi:hypothetical protein
MVPDVWVYRAADRLIAEHGEEALDEVNRQITAAIDRHEGERVLLMFRVRLGQWRSYKPRRAGRCTREAVIP